MPPFAQMDEVIREHVSVGHRALEGSVGWRCHLVIKARGIESCYTWEVREGSISFVLPCFYRPVFHRVAEVVLLVRRCFEALSGCGQASVEVLDGQVADCL